MPTSGVWVTLVIPAYNEAQRLPLTLGAWWGFFATQDYRAEVLVVDDGSRDATSDVVQGFAREVAGGAGAPEVRLLTLGRNQGKGGAVRSGVRRRQAPTSSTSTPTSTSPPSTSIMNWARPTSDYDVVAGQRRLWDYASTERSATRVLAGALVQATRRTVVLPTIRDTQCGFKGFRAAAAQGGLPARPHPFLRLRRGSAVPGSPPGGRGSRSSPVEVTFRAGSSYDVRRHLLPFLGDILAIRRNAFSGAYR